MPKRKRLKRSGGVIIAATINMMTRACRRYFFRCLGVTSPILAKKKAKTGISNTAPIAIDSVVNVDM